MAVEFHQGCTEHPQGAGTSLVTSLSHTHTHRHTPTRRGDQQSQEEGVWVQSLWLLPVWGGGQEDLQGHGEAGQLGHAVGQGARGCPEAQQVGNGVDDPSHTEDEEVDSGHCGTGIQQGVDGSKEEEGKDVLHVIAVGPEK